MTSLKGLTAYNPNADIDLLKKGLRLLCQVHSGQARLSGSLPESSLRGCWDLNH